MGTFLACGHEVADEHQVHYCSYLHLDQLLALQPEGRDLRNPDEHLFVLTHQAFELWLKQILFDMQRAIEVLDHDNVGAGIRLVQRITRVAALFGPMSQVLETMAFSDFFAFRGHLAPASGSESQQFPAVEILAGIRDAKYRKGLETPVGPDSEDPKTRGWTPRLEQLWNTRSLNDAVMDLLRRRGVAPSALYVVTPAANPHLDLFLLAEALLDFDETFAVWRFMHARMAERAIGRGTQGTAGSSGVRYLDSVVTARPHFFPTLWEARLAHQGQ